MFLGNTNLKEFLKLINSDYKATRRANRQAQSSYVMKKILPGLKLLLEHRRCSKFELDVSSSVELEKCGGVTQSGEFSRVLSSIECEAEVIAARKACGLIIGILGENNPGGIP
jgi:hypothetical protein